MKQFRLPRKVKKSLKGSIWLYPADEKGNSMMAFPARSQKDFSAHKDGILRNLFDPVNAKARKKEMRDSLDKVNIVSDEELKHYVDDLFRVDLRTSSFNTLIEAKNNPRALIAYYNFVNAFQLYEKGEESYGNICCLSLDRAKELLKKKRK